MSQHEAKQTTISQAEAPRDGCRARIRRTLPVLGKAERRIADQILARPWEVLRLRIGEVAEAASAGEATVIRFVRRLGYAGFSDFKLALSRDLAEPLVELQGQIEPHDDLATIVAKITATNAQAVRLTSLAVQSAGLGRVVEWLAASSRALAYGVGTSALAAQHASFQLSRVGVQCEALSDPAHGALAASTLRPGDVALLFSASGISRNTVTVGALARERGAAVVAVTSFDQSPLAELATQVLLTAVYEEPLYRGTTGAAIAQLHLVDLLHALLVTRSRDRSLTALEETGAAMARMSDLGAERWSQIPPRRHADADLDARCPDA